MGALQFVNDPILAPGERAPFALRAHAGEAMGWDPKVCSVEELVAFLGDGHVLVNGKAYWESSNGTLTPVRGQDRPGVFVRWLSDMPGCYTAEWIKTTGCIVRADGGADLEAVQAAATIQAQGIADLQAELVEAMREIADRDARITELEAEVNALDALPGLQRAAVAAGHIGPEGHVALDHVLKPEAIASLALANSLIDVDPVAMLSPDADTAAAPAPKPARSKQAK